MGSVLSQGQGQGQGPSRRRVGFDLPFEWEIPHGRRVPFFRIIVHSRPCYIHTLPVELLAQIFEYCVPRSALSPHLSKIASDDAPLILLSVCRLWREVASGTHSLWDSVCPSQNSIVFMKRWLTITPKIPFHLRLTAGPDHNAYEYERAMWKLFSTTTSHRWKSLELQFELSALDFTEDLFEFIREATRGLSVPLHLLVTIYRGGYSRQIKEIFSALPLTTPMERFRWRHCTRFPRDFRPCFEQVPAAGKGLRILEISHPATTVKFVQGDKRAAGSVPSLPFLSQRVGGGPLAQSRHECLTSLSLSSRTDPMAILARFTFPSLRKLCIGMSNRDRFAFTEFLERTPMLRSLLVRESDEVDDYALRYYFTSPAMRGVPDVRVAFRYASKRGVKIVKANLGLFKALGGAFVCWRQPYGDDDPERLFRDPKKLVVFVGWGGEGEGSSRRIWCFHHGALEFRTKAVLLV